MGASLPQLSELGLAALHGSSPDVGIAGYSLGGGMGWLARKYGLQTNSVTAVELVTADGRAARVDAENEPDLFWALRGGNGNFGLVTAIEFAVYPVENLYAGAMFFPFERAGEVLHAWTELLPTLPDELMTWAKLLQFPDAPDVPEPVRGGAFTVIFGAFLGSESEGRALLRPVRDPRSGDRHVRGRAAGGARRDGDGPARPAAVRERPPRCSTICRAPASTSSSPPPAQAPDRRWRWWSCATWAAPSRAESPGAGARATLPGSIAMLSLGVAEDEAAAATARTYLDAVDRAVLPYRSGDYPNFVMQPADASSFFDPDTWARLRQ